MKDITTVELTKACLHVCATPSSAPKARFDTLQQFASPIGNARGGYTTVLWRAMQVASTSSMGLFHQSLEKISISE